jgi:hypothetical protein
MGAQGLSKMFRAESALEPEPIEISPPEQRLANLPQSFRDILKDIPAMYMGAPAIGTIGASGKFSKLGRIMRDSDKGGGSGKIPSHLRSIYKPIEETEQELIKDIHNKAFQTLTPEEKKLGEVIVKELPEEQIGKVLTEQEILDKIQDLKSVLTDIKSRNISIEQPTKTRTMDKVRELIRLKNMAKHSGK